MKASDLLHRNRIFILIEKKRFTDKNTGTLNQFHRWNNILDSTY